MRKYLLPLLMIAVIFAACDRDNDEVRDDENAEEQNRYTYPEATTVEHEDDYFGTRVQDPYRWMERIESDTVADWVKRQNQFAESYFDTIEMRGKIKSRLEELHNYPKRSAPSKEGNKYFFRKNDGLQNQSVLYVSDSAGGEGEVFLDPNKLSDKGTTALGGFEVSRNGKYAAYSLAEAGSDWNTIRVMSVDDKKLLDDEVKWVKFSGIAWRGDGFYYTRFPQPEEGKAISHKNLDAKIYYHKIGTPQSQDKVVYEDPQHPKRYFYAVTTSKEKYLVVFASEGTYGSAVYIKNLQKPNSQFVKLVDNFNNEFGLAGGDGDNIYLQTDKDAPRLRVVKVNMANSNPQMETVIEQDKEMVLQGASIAGGRILTTWQKDVVSVLQVHNLSGEKVQIVELPTLGSASGFSGKNEDSVIYFTFQSFVYPPTVFEYNIRENSLEEFYRSQIKFDQDKYETKQVFYESKDGTKIPMFITHKKGIELNGQNPTLLYGYGGFNISINPSFGSPSKLVFMENGGIFAVANIRGGSEYGEDWHKAGMLEKKQNVFDDFIAAAEYLISEKYTSSKKLAISGRSNGGLLVGACMVQRPELFKVALPAVGVLDMLRYQHFSIGRAWAVEYGHSEDSAQFQFLYKYSPYHNIDSACYPATLVTTGDHDDRVVPAHSYKFAAQLQRHQTCNNPIVIRIETDAGHGAGKPISKMIEEDVDIYTFMFQNLGMKVE